MKNDESKKFQELNGLVFEYLSYHGLVDTVRSFEQELKRLLNERPGTASLSIPDQKTRPLSASQIQHNKEEMMSSLEHGNMASFFSMWEKYVGAKLRTSDDDTIRLEFFARLYAATIALREGSRDMKAHKKNIEEFKNYIDRKGNLIRSPDLLPFYALPYIPEPSTHPSFATIFQKPWKEDLFSQISDYLDQTFVRPQQAPALHSLLKNDPKPNTLSSSISIEKTERGKNEQNGNLKHLEERYKELHYVSEDLIRALGGVMKGKRLNIEFLRCAKEKLDSLNFSQLNLTPASINDNLSSSMSLSKASLYAALDYQKIRKSFSSGDRDQIPYILQALRWRLNKTKPRQASRMVLQSFISGDLFGLQSGDKVVLKSLLSDREPLVIEYTLRILNAFASESIGIQYLLSCLKRSKGNDSFPINDLMTHLTKEPSDTLSRQNIIGTLQKISIRRSAQPKFIELNGIETMCKILRNGAEKCGDYSAEYGTALLMNLCLGRGARAKYEANHNLILTTLSDLLEYDNPQVRTYVHGALYTILNASPLMREKAQELGMEDMLTERPDDELNHQVAHVLKILFEGGDIRDSLRPDKDEMDEVQEEYDEDEGDDNEEEEETIEPSESSGERLLCTLFLASNETAREEAIIMNNVKRPATSSTNFQPRASMSKGPHVSFSLDEVVHKSKRMIDDDVQAEYDYDDD
ncbi:hypothetical protein AKO1_012402 [Acrasis kona]|uniref:LisH domain-containing protein ARMC9 n=1 Tax=Acrasis kona TaxID=1008807 RepID=A0AAW2YYB3_9EUKA